MKKNNLKFQVAAGVILIISGIPLLLSNYIKEKRDVVFSEMNLVLSEINTRDIENVEEEPAVEEPTEEVKEDNTDLSKLTVAELKAMAKDKGKSFIVKHQV